MIRWWWRCWAEQSSYGAHCVIWLTNFHFVILDCLLKINQLYNDRNNTRYIHRILRFTFYLSFAWWKLIISALFVSTRSYCFGFGVDFSLKLFNNFMVLISYSYLGEFRAWTNSIGKCIVYSRYTIHTYKNNRVPRFQ